MTGKPTSLDNGGFSVRDRTRVVTGVLAVLLAATALWGYNQYSARAQLNVHLNNRYQHEFEDLISSVENVQIALGKCLVSGSMRGNIIHLTDVARYAETGQARLSNLPLPQNVRSRSATFLAQAGDFATVMAQKNASGDLLTESERNTLARLHTEAGVLAKKLHEIAGENSEGIRWGRLQDTADDEFEEASEDIGGKFVSIDKQMMEYPTLIYDGPFSDSVIGRTPKGLDGPEVSRDEARDRAAACLRGAGIEFSSLKDSGTTNGKIKAYSFEAVRGGTAQQDNPVVIEVSVRKGIVTWFADTRPVEEAKLQRDEAIERAETFLERIGYDDMEATYSSIELNIATIPFVAVSDDTRIYPDMVKVRVALDNGDILGFDAVGYIMNHQDDRVMHKPKITEEEARERVNTEFDVGSTRLAVIPSYADEDTLCWEFIGKYGPDDYVVYINALTGQEERILKVIDLPSGQFAM